MMKYLSYGMAMIVLGTWSWSDTARRNALHDEEARILPGRLVQETRERTRVRGRFYSPSQSSNQRTDATVLRTFEEAVGNTWESTVRVMATQGQVALGVIVDPSGWIVTKASQLPSGELQCQLYDKRRITARKARVNLELDLALLKIDAYQLPVVEWHPEDFAPVGAWLATTTTQQTPLGVGVVSVGPRKITASSAVMGIKLDPDEKINEARVTKVYPGGGAYRAGIEEDDVILSIDGTKIPSRPALYEKLRALRGGQRINIEVLRSSETRALEVQLSDFGQTLFDEQEMEVNGNISARSTGFTKAFQHDTVLAPHQCGGPVIDSYGRVVGLNIARAGRVSSYALPLDLVIPAVKDLLATSKIPVSTSIQ